MNEIFRMRCFESIEYIDDDLDHPPPVQHGIGPEHSVEVLSFEPLEHQVQVSVVFPRIENLRNRGVPDRGRRLRLSEKSKPAVLGLTDPAMKHLHRDPGMRDSVNRRVNGTHPPPAQDAFKPVAVCNNAAEKGRRGFGSVHGRTGA